MISEIIKESIEILKITPYEETLITKLTYNFKLKKSDYVDLFLLKLKINLYKEIEGRRKKCCVGM